MNQDTARVTDPKRSKRIAILQSYGTSLCHVPAGELEKVEKVNNTVRDAWHGLSRRVHDVLIGDVNVQIHNFLAEESLVKLLAHWIHHRDAEAAINATIHRKTETTSGTLDEEWLDYLIDAMELFDNPNKFICDIRDSLIDCFIHFLIGGGLEHIDRVYEICHDRRITRTLTSVFANVFIHDKKEFAKKARVDEYDRVVQRHMQDWLADVWINDKDWDKLPPQLGHHTSNACFHRKHGKDKACYVHGRIITTS
jgi:hypothetical protein